MLHRMYGDRLVQDANATEDFSVAMGQEDVDGRRPIPVLLRGRCPVVRSRLQTRLLRRLDQELAAIEDDARSAVVTLHDMGAVIRDGRAVLVPGGPLAPSGLVERAVRSAGAQLAEPAGLALDPHSRSIEVRRGPSAGHPETRDDLAPIEVHHRLLAVLLADPSGDTTLTAGHAVTRFLGHVRLPGGAGRAEMLAAVAALHPLLPETTISNQDGTSVERALGLLRA